MTRIEFKNLQVIPLREIPRLPIDRFRNQVIEGVNAGERVVQFFGMDDAGGTILLAVLADDERSRLAAFATVFGSRTSYPSITPEAPALHLFEREFHEQFGIVPEGHPWLKPVRRGIAGSDPRESAYPFFIMEGEDIHEVGVGPVHAGIIEPGHFRFSCQGEDVHHLEIGLGFQHRGVEDLFLRFEGRPAARLCLAESIAGDSVIGHAGAYAAVMETLGNVEVNHRALVIRTIALEWERVGNHLGDLSAIANDVAYLTGNAVFGNLRTRAVNTTMAFSGSRYGKGLIAAGGVRRDIDAPLKDVILSAAAEIEEKSRTASDVFFSSASVLARLENTGVIDEETARRIGMVGPAARASGRALDVRSDHPAGGYAFFPVYKKTLSSGDVFARAFIRFAEIEQSLRFIREQTEALNGSLDPECPAPALRPDSLAVSLVEGWRGEIAHIGVTDARGKLRRYKIKDPSFANWFALALAVRKNGISDFPLCNKSFNLSYCGFDL